MVSFEKKDTTEWMKKIIGLVVLSLGVLNSIRIRFISHLKPRVRILDIILEKLTDLITYISGLKTSLINYLLTQNLYITRC